MLSRRDYFIQHYMHLIKYWGTFVPVFDDCTALKQPISLDDLIECIFNAMQLEGIEGKTFECAGPFVYQHKELIEIIKTALDRPIKIAYVNRELALQVSKVFGWRYFNREDIIKSSLDLVATQQNGEGNCSDLFVQPASVAPYINNILYTRRDRNAMTKVEREI